MEDTNEAQAEEYERRRLEAVNKYRAEALQKRMDLIASRQQERAKEAEEKESDQEAKQTQMVKKPLDKATEGGSEVLGAVGETFAEIGEKMVKPPAEKLRQEGEEGKGVEEECRVP